MHGRLFNIAGNDTNIGSGPVHSAWFLGHYLYLLLATVFILIFKLSLKLRIKVTGTVSDSEHIRSILQRAGPRPCFL